MVRQDELNAFSKMKTPVYIFGWNHVLFLLLSPAWHDYFENSYGRIRSEKIKSGERCHTMGQVSRRMKLVILLARVRDTSFPPSTCLLFFLTSPRTDPTKGGKASTFVSIMSGNFLDFCSPTEVKLLFTNEPLHLFTETNERLQHNVNIHQVFYYQGMTSRLTGLKVSCIYTFHFLKSETNLLLFWSFCNQCLLRCVNSILSWVEQ